MRSEEEFKSCYVWYDPDVLMDSPFEDFEYRWVREFTWACVLPDGHDGPHLLDLFFMEEPDER